MSLGTVLHCIPTMSGGGAERQLTYLAGELERLGWSTHVAVMRRGPNWSRLKASGATIHELSARSAHDPSLFTRLWRLAGSIRPCLIQSWLLQMEVLGGLVALGRGTPWVFAERSSLGAYPLTFKNVLRQVLVRRAAAIVSNSRGGDEYWRDRVGPGVRRYVIPNGIPLPEIDVEPEANLATFGLRPDLPLVLFAGRLEAEKNLETLLAALDLVVDHRELQLLWCGEGSRRKMIEAWISARGLGSRAKVAGYVSNIWGLMKRATVLVSPSVFEGSPNVVLEAMACGVPLVVSAIPQHREFLTEDSALLVAPRSPSQLAAAIQQVLVEPGSAQERSRRARETALRFSLPAIAQQYSRVYEELLARDRR